MTQDDRKEGHARCCEKRLGPHPAPLTSQASRKEHQASQTQVYSLCPSVLASSHGHASSMNYVTPAEKLYYGTMLFGLLAKDELKVRIHAEYEFTADRLARAHSDLVGGKTTGKFVVQVAEE